MEAYYLREILKELVKLRMEIRDLMPVPQGDITSTANMGAVTPEPPTQQEKAEEKKTKFKKKEEK